MYPRTNNNKNNNDLTFYNILYSTMSVVRGEDVNNCDN